MKTARLILTITMLLSLNTISQCSESENNENQCQKTDGVITASRQNSGIHHDGTRDGLFGSGLDTLKNIRNKQSYRGKPYGLGSDEQAPDRWSSVGKNDIKIVVDAETFITEVNKKGWILSPEAVNPSKKLIQEHYSQSKKAAQVIIAKATQKLQAQIENEKTVAQQLRDLQAQALKDQKICNTLLPFDGINNNFSKGKQLNDTNIRSFITEQLKQSTQTNK